MSRTENNKQADQASRPVARNEHGEIIIDEAARAASRKKLVWIFALFFLPLFFATIWFQVVRTGAISWGSTSRGELISPAVPFSEFSLNELGASEAFDLDDVRGKWTILYAPGPSCDVDCEATLADIRQARLALNHRMLRVQRVLLVEQDPGFGAEMLDAQLGLRIVGQSAEANAAFTKQIDAAVSGMDVKTNIIYLIDPNGNLMMRYTPDQLPRPLFKDLKHLLKVSRIG